MPASVIGSARSVEEFNVMKLMGRHRGIRICPLKGIARHYHSIQNFFIYEFHASGVRRALNNFLHVHEIFARIVRFKFSTLRMAKIQKCE
jgi:hypothetical protein